MDIKHSVLKGCVYMYSSDPGHVLDAVWISTMTNQPGDMKSGRVTKLVVVFVF